MSLSRYLKLSLTALLFTLFAHPSDSVAVSVGNYRSTDIVYQSPLNGDRYVLPPSTLIFRLSKEFMAKHSVSSLMIEVLGSVSGSHSGSFILSDDGETVIFKPATVFALDEDVSVILKVSSQESSIVLDAFSFHTTKLSSQEQALRLAELNAQEQAEYKNFIQDGQDAKPANNSFSMLSLPDDFPNLNIQTNTNPSQGKYYFGTLNFNAPKPPNVLHTYLMAIKNDGSMHYYNQSTIPTIDFKYQAEANAISYFLATGTLGAGAYTGVYVKTDLDHNFIDSFKCGNGYPTDGHDFMILKNGHVLLGSYDPQTVDMTKIVSDPNAKTNATVFGTVIQELDAQKNVVFEWKSWDHFQITDHTPDIADTSKLIDYSHWNSLKQDTDGNIIVSSRNMDEITKINRTTGAIMWRLGGKNNQFTITGDTEKVFISHQHDAQRLANGNMSVWDNGNEHKPPFSRAMEFTIDETAKTVNKVWEFHHPLKRFTFAAGNAQRLPNGNTVIGWGIVQDTILPAVTEVDPSGNIVFEAKLPLLNISYRAFKFDINDKADVKKTENITAPVVTMYPNPAMSQTSISISLPKAAQVGIQLFDILGRAISSSIVNANSGIYNSELSTVGLPTGSYYVKVTVNGVATTKLLQVRQ